MRLWRTFHLVVRQCCAAVGEEDNECVQLIGEICHGLTQLRLGRDLMPLFVEALSTALDKRFGSLSAALSSFLGREGLPLAFKDEQLLDVVEQLR